MTRKDLMKFIIFLLAILVILQAASIFFGRNGFDIRQEFIGLKEQDFVDAAEKATPAVVFIATDNKSGSGIIINKEGIIVTNNHVVENAVNISVRLADKRIFRGEVIGRDDKADIALVKINAGNLSALEFGDSEKVEVGEPVIAIGNPYGYDFTVTTGIISAKHRERGPTEYRDFLQTDASINPGNSGGPLVNLRGEVIGINTFIVSEGIAGELGFAIPSNLVKDLTEQILEFGKVERGFMGLRVNDFVDLDETGSGRIVEGSLVVGVLEDGPSAESGIEINDLIIKINNKTIADSNSLRNLIASYRPGEKVKVIINRNKTIMEFDIKLGMVPE